MSNSEQSVSHISTEDPPSTASGGTSTWVVWALALLTLAVIGIAVVLGMQILEDQPVPRSEKLMTPIVGGMALSGPTDLPTASASEASVSPVPQNPTGTADRSQFTPGQTVAAKDVSVAIYSDASPSAVPMDSYGIGARFTILESTGDYDQYPVEHGGRQWIRVRSSDGLAGWVAIDTVVPLPQ